MKDTEECDDCASEVLHSGKRDVCSEPIDAFMRLINFHLLVFQSI